MNHNGIALPIGQSVASSINLTLSQAGAGGELWPGGYTPLAFTGGSFPSYGRLVVDPVDYTLTVTGSFATVNGVAKVNRAKVLADGTVDNTWVPPVVVGADSYHDKALDAGNGKVWAIGRYTLVEGVFRPLFRMNSNGSRDVTFEHAPVIGTAGNISRWVCPLPDGGVMVGCSGVVTAPYTIDGQPSDWARLNADGTMSANQPPPHRQGAGSFGIGSRMATCDDGRVVFSFLGNTNTISGNTAAIVVCLNADYTMNNAAPVTLDVGSGYNTIYKVFRHGAHLYFCGSFTQFNGHTTFGIARTDQNFNVDTSFVAPVCVPDIVPNADNEIYVPIIEFTPSGKLLAGYSDYYYEPFTIGGLTSRCGLMLLNTDGSIDTAFYNNLSPDVQYCNTNDFHVLPSGYIYTFTYKLDGTKIVLILAPDGTLVYP